MKRPCFGFALMTPARRDLLIMKLASDWSRLSSLVDQPESKPIKPGGEASCSGCTASRIRLPFVASRSGRFDDRIRSEHPVVVGRGADSEETSESSAWPSMSGAPHTSTHYLIPASSAPRPSTSRSSFPLSTSSALPLRHTAIAMYECGTCGKVFPAGWRARDNHCRATGHCAPDYECDTCDRWFSSDDAKWQHMERKNHFAWDCDDCDETWPTEKRLKEHQVDDHFYCDDCDRYFNSLNNIKMVSKSSTLSNGAVATDPSACLLAPPAPQLARSPRQEHPVSLLQGLVHHCYWHGAPSRGRILSERPQSGSRHDLPHRPVQGPQRRHL